MSARTSNLWSSLMSLLIFNFFFGATQNFLMLDWYSGYTNSILLSILIMVFIFMVFLYFNKSFFKINGIMYQMVEILCVILPTLLVCTLVYYSLFMLYSLSLLDVWSLLTLKVIGSQWYWHYEFSDLGVNFDSVMTPLEDLSSLNLYRNFDTTPALVLPQGIPIRGCLTASDVIHSWSLPSLGVKMDCNPGMLSVVTFKVPMVGSFWGACAEICGVGHSMMPIHLESVTPNLFLNYILTFLLFIMN